jgi:hydrogenase maturation protease
MSRDSEPSRAVVIGYGNTLLGDDGIGWRAVEALVERGLPAASAVVTAHQLDPELARTLAVVKFALFVDAARGGRPGEIRCAPVTPESCNSTFSHQLEPASLLALTRVVYGSAPSAFALTMFGERFDLSEGLSPACEAALPALVDLLVRKLAR